MNKTFFSRSIVALLVPSLLTACGSVGTKVGGTDFNKASAINEDLQVKKEILKPANPKFRVDNGVFVDSKPLANSSYREQEPLPPVFAREVAFDFRAPVSLRAITDRLSAFSGALVTLSPDVYSVVAGGGVEMGNAVAMQSSANINPAVKAAAGAAAAAAPAPVAAASAAQLVDKEILFPDFVYTGNIENALDKIGARTGLGWKWDGKTIVLYRYDTISFRVKHISGQSSTKGSAATAEVNLKFEPWADIEKTMPEIVSKEGKFIINPSLGYVTVTDTPLRLRMAEKFFKKINADLSQQVRMKIDVFSVTATDQDQFAFDWDLVWQSLSGRYNFAWASSGGASSIANTLKSSVLTPVKIGSGEIQASNAVFGALSKMGKTSLVSSNTITTISGHPAPFDVTTSTVYLQSTQTTIQGTSGATTTTLQPGTLETGFSMSVTPKIIEADKIALEYNLNVSDLIVMNEFTTSSNSIQMPTTSKRNIFQRLNVKNGETVILSGLQQTTTNLKGQGPGSASAWVLGGSKDNTSAKTSLVVVITPVLLAD